jgi:hypothetical protein
MMKFYSKLVFLSLFFSFSARSFSQQVFINEAMSLNASIISDEDGAYSNWIELYNAADEPVNLQGYGLSDDKNNLLKWIFPATTIAPKSHILIFTSGKDRKDIYYWKNVIHEGDLWKYSVDNDTVQNTWNGNDFDDSTWPQGPSGFGYGDKDDSTVLNNVNSVFIRKTFSVDDETKIKRLMLHLDYDDGFVAYLNGVEIARANIGTIGDRPAFSAVAKTSHEAVMYSGGKPEAFMIENITSLLHNGTNLLAIQIHNTGSGSTDMTGIPFLSLALDAPVPEPNTLPEWWNLADNNLHTNFDIKSSGEFISLSNPDGQILDSLHTIVLPIDKSYGRFPDGMDEWFVMSNPTPAASNIDTINLGLCEKPVFSLAAGFYPGSISVSLSTNTPNSSLYYTLDSKEPTNASLSYITAINVNSTLVIRARCYSSETNPSLIATGTYLINEHSTMPVISLTTDPYNLYDPDYGIFLYWDPYYESNLFQDWERPVHVEYYEADGTPGFSLDAGMKVHGGLTRGQSQKALNIYARNIYGTNQIDYKLFNDLPQTTYQSFVLRNGGNDFKWTIFRDELMHSLIGKEMDIEHSAFKPSTVFLNGSYYGIEHFHEKINENFIAAHTGIDKDKIDMLEFIPYDSNVKVLNGKSDAWLQLVDYIGSHDLADSAYFRTVASQVDIENFISYEVANMYFDNGDWPGNNIKWWRPNDPAGKWRWILFDTDFGFGLSPFGTETGEQLLHYKHNTLATATASTGESWPNPPYSTFLMRNLLKNRSFKEQFINTFCDYLNTAFQASVVNEKINALENDLAPEIQRHHQRFPESAGNWTNDIQVMSTFADLRVNYVFTHIRVKFALQPTKVISLDVSGTSQGRIQINTQVLKSYPWTGRYFPKIPVTITARPEPGHQFTGWNDGNKSLTRVIDLSTDQSYTAYFDEVTGNNDSAIVINEINYKSAANLDTKDWIELYNNSGVTMDVSGWLFRDDDDQHAYIFQVPTTIQPYNYLVLCRDVQAFKLINPEAKHMAGDLDFKLSSSGDVLRLYNAGGTLIDRVSYGSISPWPDLTGLEGSTLELIDPGLDNALPFNWKASGKKGGSPDAINGASVVTDVRKHYGLELSLENYPNPFHESTTITCQLSESAHVTLAIINMMGETVNVLVNRDQSAGTFEVEWNGTDATGTELPSGIYIYRLSTDKVQISRRLMLIR